VDPAAGCTSAPSRRSPPPQELIFEGRVAGCGRGGERRYIAWRQRRAAGDCGGRGSLDQREDRDGWACRAMRVQSRRLAICDVAVVSLPGDGGRPPARGTARWCTRPLATVPLDAAPDVIHRDARMQGRIVGATEPEIESAVSVAAAVLAHPLLSAGERPRRQAAAARDACGHDCRGRARRGCRDLAFDDGALVSCDRLQADRELEGAMDTYRRQSRSTRTPIALATGRPTRGVLMKI